MFVLDPRSSLTVDELYGSQRVYDLVSAALVAQRQGNLPAAISSAAGALSFCARDEHRARCQQLLAGLHLAAGEYEACEREALDAARLLRDERDRNLRLAYAARTAREGSAAGWEIADLTVPAQHGEPSLRAFGRAVSLQRWGYPNAALVEVNAAIAHWPMEVPAFFALRAALHAALRNIPEAEADAERALALSPGDVDALLVRARLAFQASELDTACSCASSAIRRCDEALDAETGDQGRWLAKQAQAFALRARAQMAGRRYDGAAEDAISATGRDPTVLEHWLTRIEAEARAGSIDDVLDVVELAAFTQTEAREKARVFTLCAQLQEEEGHLAEALETANRALRFSEDYAAAYRERAEIWRRLGDDNQALSDTKRADELEGVE